MRKVRSIWWQLARMLDVRTTLWIVGFIGVIGSIVIFALLTAHVVDKATLNSLKALILPFVIAALGTFGGAWFTRERARDTALQAYLEKMSELLIDKKIHREHRRYADTRVTARARTLAVLSQLNGKRKGIVLMFLREARLINRQWHVRDGRKIYPRIVGLRNADLSGAHLRDAQLLSSDGKETISLEGADLRGTDLRVAVLRGADLRGADLRGTDLREVDLGVSEETKKAADLTSANLTDADLRGARYDAETSWPHRFDLEASGAVAN